MAHQQREITEYLKLRISATANFVNRGIFSSDSYRRFLELLSGVEKTFIKKKKIFSDPIFNNDFLNEL